MSTSKRTRKASAPRSRKPADAADLDDDPRSRITFAVLEQLCWHMFCCEVIFDASFEILWEEIGDADPDAVELAERAGELSDDLQGVYRAVTEKRLGFTALSPAENATLTIERAANAGVSSVSNRADAPRCYAPGCDGPALDLGHGSWSGGCLTHISLSDREMHEMFIASGDHARERADFLRRRLNRSTAIALVTWWNEMGGPQQVFEEAIRSETELP